MTTMADVLGPFQDFWDAWSEVDEEIKGKKLPHFSRAVQIQYDEMQEHLDRDDLAAAAREAADVISIALNTMRWLGLQPGDIAKIAQARAEDRMRGQTHAILDKYESHYGI